MKIAARVGAYLLGLALGSGVFAGLSYWKPGMWLPAALSVVLAALLQAEPWVRKRNLGAPLSIAIFFGMVAGWLVSSGATMQVTRAMRNVSVGASALAALVSVFVLVRIAKMPANLRPAAGWICVPVVMTWTVSVASSSVAGSGHMVHWLVLHLGWSKAAATIAVHWVRKTIHVCWYGLLAFSARTAAVFGGEKAGVAARFGLCYGIAVASFDEMRQSTQPGRNGSFWDVVLDTSGMVAFVLLAHLFASLRRPARRVAT